MVTSHRAMLVAKMTCLGGGTGRNLTRGPPTRDGFESLKKDQRLGWPFCYEVCYETDPWMVVNQLANLFASLPYFE